MHDDPNRARKRSEAAKKGAKTRAAQKHARELWERRAERNLLHPLLQTIRGMCADEMPYGEIDQAVARAVDIAKDLEEELAAPRVHPDQTVDMVTSIVAAMNGKPFPAEGFEPLEGAEDLAEWLANLHECGMCSVSGSQARKVALDVCSHCGEVAGPSAHGHSEWPDWHWERVEFRRTGILDTLNQRGRHESEEA